MEYDNLSVKYFYTMQAKIHNQCTYSAMSLNGVQSVCIIPKK